MDGAFVLITLINLALNIRADCFEETDKNILCYDESHYDHHVTAKVLRLFDSYISRSTFERFFPNVEVVYVEGRFQEHTCKQLQGLIKLYDCSGKNIFLLLLAVAI